MSGLDHGWNKGDKPNHADFIHGAVEESDFDEESRTPHRSGSKRKGRKRPCSKSKHDEMCLYTVKTYQHQWYNERIEKWCSRSELSCERCGRKDWASSRLEYSLERPC